MTHKTADRLYLPAALALTALFLFLCFHKLTRLLPAIDEIWITIEALRFMDWGKYEELTSPLFFGPPISIPSMPCFYSGTLNNFLQMPFLHFFAPSYLAMRIPFIMLAAAGLLSLNYCLSRWLGKWTALLVLFLTVTDTMFIRTVRHGSEHEEIFVMNMFWMGMAFFLLKARTGKTRYLAGAGLIWGIAVWSKLHIFACISGTAAAYFFFGFDKLARDSAHRMFHKARDGVIFCLSFMVGLFPFINAHFSKEYIMQDFWFAIVRPKPLTLPEIFVLRLGQFWRFMNEEAIDEWLVMPETGAPVFALCALVLILLYAFVRIRSVPDGKRALAKSVLLVYALSFFSILFVPKIVCYAHVTVMLIFLEIAAGIIVWAALNMEKGRLRTFVLTALSCVMVFTLAQRYMLFASYFRKHDENNAFVEWTNSTFAEVLKKTRGRALIISPLAHSNLLGAQLYGRPLRLAAADGDRPDHRYSRLTEVPENAFLLTSALNAPNHHFSDRPAGLLVWKPQFKSKHRPHYYQLYELKEPHLDCTAYAVFNTDEG